jgi:hypothetical protein
LLVKDPPGEFLIVSSVGSSSRQEVEPTPLLVVALILGADWRHGCGVEGSRRSPQEDLARAAHCCELEIGVCLVITGVITSGGGSCSLLVSWRLELLGDYRGNHQWRRALLTAVSWRMELLGDYGGNHQWRRALLTAVSWRMEMLGADASASASAGAGGSFGDQSCR